MVPPGRRGPGRPARSDSDTSGLPLPVNAQCALPMPTIEMLTLAPPTRPTQLWRSVADATRRWLDHRQLRAADAVLLLPFADLLAPARRALASDASWLPRVHT